MDLTHLHLLLNHVPVVGAVLGVLLVSVALVRHSDELGKAALGLFALLAVASVVVFLTGEPAEELVEKLPGFSHAITERHEDAARVAMIAMGLTGAFCLIALVIFRKRPLARWVTPVALVVSLGTATVMGYAANLGGQIRHTELRAAATSIPVGEAEDDDAPRR